MFPEHQGIKVRRPVVSFSLYSRVEALRRLMIEAEKDGLLVGCKVGRNGPLIPLLQFADDILFFVLFLLEHMQNLRCLLLLFEAASGLRVNLLKSKLLGVEEVSVNLNPCLLLILGCLLELNPSLNAYGS